MATIIHVDGTISHLPPEGLDGALTLLQLQTAVGGYIEHVRIPGDELEMFVNEEGLLIGLEYNPMASLLAQQHIVGNVVVCTPHEGGEDESDESEDPDDQEQHRKAMIAALDNGDFDDE